MSQEENVNFCSIFDLAFETRKQFVKHSLGDENLNKAKKEYEDEVEDETKEKVYDVEEDDYILKPKTITKDNTKDIIKTKTETEAKNNMYTRIKFECEETQNNIYSKIRLAKPFHGYECKECHEELRKKNSSNYSLM